MRRRAEGPESDISTMTRHPVRTEDRGGTWATRILTLVMGLAVVAVPLPQNAAEVSTGMADEIELSSSASTDSAAIPARPTAPALKIDDPYRYALSYQIENLKWHAGRSGLVDGMRPEPDLPPEDRKIFGRRLSDGDWLLLQGETGIWVTGVPAPPAAVPVVVHGIFEDASGGARLKASHIFKDGGRLGHARHDIRRGEHIYFELPGARSVICPVEIGGDCVRAAFLDEATCVILEAVKPGSATVTVYELFRLDDQRKQIGRFEISVHD